MVRETGRRVSVSVPHSDPDPAERYLAKCSAWIDCLCLTQDLHKGWERRTLRMVEICEHSIPANSGSVACSADTGLFTPRLHPNDVRVSYRNRSGGASVDSIGMKSSNQDKPGIANGTRASRTLGDGVELQVKP